MAQDRSTKRVPFLPYHTFFISAYKTSLVLVVVSELPQVFFNLELMFCRHADCSKCLDGQVLCGAKISNHQRNLTPGTACDRGG